MRTLPETSPRWAVSGLAGTALSSWYSNDAFSRRQHLPRLRGRNRRAEHVARNE